MFFTLSSEISEMCTKPSLPLSNDTKAPKSTIFSTVPKVTKPTSGSDVINSIFCKASSRSSLLRP